MMADQPVHASASTAGPAPLVSILIPCHNAAPWLDATLASALAQSYPHTEVIVVDDGSTDASAAIAGTYAARGVRLVQQVNRGAAAARNLALREARGRYLQFLDADDLLDRDKIAVQVTRLAAEPPGRVASGAWAGFSAAPDTARFTPEPVWRDAAPLDWLVLSWDGGGMMHPAAWLTPTEVARHAGPWNESLSLDDDGEYFCRVLLASSGVCFCSGARSYYRRHASGSLSHAKSRRAWESSQRACRLVQAAALAGEDSPRVRHACAMSHLRFAFNAWPYERDLARASLADARQLDPHARLPPAGTRFNLLARLLGWKTARLLQHRLQRLRAS